MHSSSWNHSATAILIIYLIDALLSETITCDNDWDSSQCREQSISCTNSSSACSIHCNGDGSCEKSTFNCNNNINAQCSIYCTGEASCRGAVKDSIIYCAANAQCNIHCDGVHSCENLNIHCPSTSNCTLHANNQYAFINAWIGCESGAKGCTLTANCNDIHSCHDSRIDARNASAVAINCANNKNACKNINLGCPQAQNGEKLCSMHGDEGTKHDAMRIYAVNSWDDIDLTTYIAQTTSGVTLESTMFCGEVFDESCIISLSSWNCDEETAVCYRNNSDIHPYPTLLPTVSPTDRKEDDDVTSWAVIIGIIVGLLVFCLFVFFCYVWCVKQKQNMDTKYGTLDTKNDPDADIMQQETQHMYRTSDPNANIGIAKSFDIATKSGLHIVNEYSDASKFGGLLPISEEKSKDFMATTANEVIEEEKAGLISANEEGQNVVDAGVDNDNVQNEQANGAI